MMVTVLNFVSLDSIENEKLIEDHIKYITNKGFTFLYMEKYLQSFDKNCLFFHWRETVK